MCPSPQSWYQTLCRICPLDFVRVKIWYLGIYNQNNLVHNGLKIGQDLLYSYADNFSRNKTKNKKLYNVQKKRLRTWSTSARCTRCSASSSPPPPTRDSAKYSILPRDEISPTFKIHIVFFSRFFCLFSRNKIYFMNI